MKIFFCGLAVFGKIRVFLFLMSIYTWKQWNHVFFVPSTKFYFVKVLVIVQNENVFIAGSIVPFSFRLIHAELPQHNGRPNVSLDRLYELLDKVEQVLENLDSCLTEDGVEKITMEDNEISGTFCLFWCCCFFLLETK